MKRKFAFGVLLISVGWLSAPAAAGAATTFQVSLVPIEADAAPGFSEKGSSVKIVSNNHVQVKGKIKAVVDANGERVSTRTNDSGDDYHIEVDIFVPATGEEDTISIPFDLKKGNGNFKLRVNGSPALNAAMSGDGVIVEEVRVFNALDEQIGGGGFSLR